MVVPWLGARAIERTKRHLRHQTPDTRHEKIIKLIPLLLFFLTLLFSLPCGVREEHTNRTNRENVPQSEVRTLYAYWGKYFQWKTAYGHYAAWGQRTCSYCWCGWCWCWCCALREMHAVRALGRRQLQGTIWRSQRWCPSPFSWHRHQCLKVTKQRAPTAAQPIPAKRMINHCTWPMPMPMPTPMPMEVQAVSAGQQQ